MNKKNIYIVIAIIITIAVSIVISKVGYKNNKVVIEEDKLNIVTTNFPQYDFIREIAGDKVNLSMLILPGSEVHSYEPTPQDIIKIQNADLFVNIGGQTDSRYESILNSFDNSHLQVFSMMNYVDLYAEELVEGMEEHNHTHGHDEDEHKDKDSEHDNEDEHDDEHDDEHEHDDNEKLQSQIVDNLVYDEHVWTSPKNAMKIVSELSKVIQNLDKKNEDFYFDNTTEYLKKLHKLDEKLIQIVDNSKRKTILFGDRFPLRYLVEDYDLDYYAAFSGCSNETDASPSTIAFLIDKVSQEDIPIVFYIESSNQKIADVICESTGHKKSLIHSIQNVSKVDFESGVSYLDLMEQNIKNLQEALY